MVKYSDVNSCDVSLYSRDVSLYSHVMIFYFPFTYDVLFILRLLLKHQPELISQTDDHGRTSIHRAAQYGSDKCLTYLHKKESNLMSKDSKGVMPIHVAAKYGQLATVKMLLSFGSTLCDVDVNERTVVHFAGSSGNVKCLHWILEQDFDLSSCDSE